MKQEYEKPTVDIMKFEVEDILTASGNWTLKDENGNPESGSDDIFR